MTEPTAPMSEEEKKAKKKLVNEIFAFMWEDLKKRELKDQNIIGDFLNIHEMDAKKEL